MEKAMVLFCDGASRGNPGPGAYGYVLYHNEEIVFEEGQCLGTVTNNTAEYQGLIKGLASALKHGATAITVKSDSELMVRQLNGIYKVKAPHIQLLFQEAKTLLREFKSIEILHIRREQNKKADALCNQALDKF
ncbi:MAG: ribonuclease HI family protein [Bdellovibrionales bacterium]|nr:ribonuclease HI family protein [Bdellovibrionales bacterium]